MKKYCLISFLIVTGCMSNKVEFKPVERTNEQYVVSDRKMDSVFVNNLEQVLKYYDKSYERPDGTSILIEEKMFADKDLMYNYTNKARDTDWLKSHKK